MHLSISCNMPMTGRKDMKMSKYRENLPQLGGREFLADSGLETTLVFHHGLDLPYFAAFDLLRTGEGVKIITDYYRRHAKIAVEHGAGFVAESATWRASSDWATKLGYSSEALDAANRKAITLLHNIRAEFETEQTPVIISGSIGPRDDGYNPSNFMTASEARHYHKTQIDSLEQAGADIISAMTMTYSDEAIGIVEAAREAHMPVSVSVTVETDGKLPSGKTIAQTIEEIDKATDAYAAYFMINCAHPDHFRDVLARDEKWAGRILGVRANASRMSHAELDAATELDDGNPAELGRDYHDLTTILPNLHIFGGCCGTDHRHIEAIAESVLQTEAA
jgi:S-methylmethionine-dependent homocysteine/selenocysteine methylase